MAKSLQPTRRPRPGLKTPRRPPAKAKHRHEEDYVPFESDPEQSVDSASDNEKLRQQVLEDAELKRQAGRTRQADYEDRIHNGTAEAEVVEKYRARRKRINAAHYQKKKDDLKKA